MTSPIDSPDAEVEVTVALVRRLVHTQHSDLGHLPLHFAAAGWDNAVFRLGDELCVRVPRCQAGATLVKHEQRWLPHFAPRLPLQTPVLVRVGEPQDDYPWAWSVCQWIDGADALSSPPTDPVRAAAALAGFLAAMHTVAPADAPANLYRGVPLAARHDIFLGSVGQVGGLLSQKALLRTWELVLETPVWAGPALWLHGDMHPRNLVVANGRLVGVIDFGDITSGDPASDLAASWLMWPNDAKAREVFRSSLMYSEDDWQRARGWAISLGTIVAANSADRPAFQVRAVQAAQSAMAGL